MKSDHTQVSEALEDSYLGAVLDADAYVEEESDGAVPYVRVGDLTELEISEARRWVDGSRGDATYADKGAVLFAEQPVPGRVSVAKRRVAIHADIRALECKSMINPLYLACSLMARQSEIQEFARGRTIPRISKGELWNIEIRVPTIEAQNRHVGLAKRYSKLKRNRQRGIKLAQSYPRTCFQDLLGRAQMEDAFYEAQLIDLVRGMKNGSSIHSTDKENTRAERVMTVGAEEVAGAGVITPETCETVEVGRESADRESLKKDEVVIVARGSLSGKAARPPDDLTHRMVPNTSLIRLRVETDKVEPTYLVHSIMSDRVQSLLSRRKSQFSSSRIRQHDLKEMRIPMVPKSIQKKFERRLTRLWPLLRSQYQSDRLIEELSDSILDRFR